MSSLLDDAVGMLRRCALRLTYHDNDDVNLDKELVEFLRQLDPKPTPPFTEESVIDGSISSGACIVALISNDGEHLSIERWTRASGEWKLCSPGEALPPLDRAAAVRLWTIIESWST